MVHSLREHHLRRARAGLRGRGAGGGTTATELHTEKSECGRYGEHSPKQDARGEVVMASSAHDRLACDPNTKFVTPAHGKNWIALIPKGNCTTGIRSGMRSCRTPPPWSSSSTGLTPTRPSPCPTQVSGLRAGSGRGRGAQGGWRRRDGSSACLLALSGKSVLC